MPLSVKNTVIFVGVIADIADIDMYMFVYESYTRVTMVTRVTIVTRVTQEYL